MTEYRTGVRVAVGMSDFNQKIIQEFRSNEGRVGGPFEGHTLLLLHHRGAKSGQERVSPLATQVLGGEGWAVFASKGGAPDHPDWFHNLRSHPEVEIEFGTGTHKVRARVVTGDEREKIWTRQKEAMPGFAEYEVKTSGIREIPVVVLEPIAA